MSYSTCPVTCTTSRLDCGDIFSVIVKSIIDLNEPGGSTASTIAARAAELCPGGSTPTSEEIDLGLAAAARRGIVYRRFESVDDVPTFMINALMVQVNPKNAKYMRYPCQQNNFFTK